MIADLIKWTSNLWFLSFFVVVVWLATHDLATCVSYRWRVVHWVYTVFSIAIVAKKKIQVLIFLNAVRFFETKFHLLNVFFFYPNNALQIVEILKKKLKEFQTCLNFSIDIENLK